MADRPASRPRSVSLCDLLTLGYLDMGDVTPGGFVSQDRRLHAERAYSRFQEQRRMVPLFPTPPPLTRSQPVVISEEEEEEEETASDGLECVVCLQRPRTYASTPCFHLCVCATCMQRVHACPVCRRPVRAFQRVFLP